jgi:hypothetical protein
VAKMRPDLEPVPADMAGLPIDERGYPVPFFVPIIGGKPEFRAGNPRVVRQCIEQNLCWVCGNKLGRHQVFLIGPIGCANRVSAEPPMHLACGVWSARNCPFLANKDRERRTDEKFNALRQKATTPGMMIERNPGVVAIWPTREYGFIGDGKGGVLFRIGEPSDKVQWFTCGRHALREEVETAVVESFDNLKQLAKDGGPECEKELTWMVASLGRYLPDSVGKGGDASGGPAASMNTK